MPHRNYKLFGPLIVLDADQPRFYLIEAFHNPATNQNDYSVYCARNAESQFEKLSPAPPQLLCAENRGYYYLELNESSITKKSARKSTGNQFVGIVPADVQEYSFTNDTFVESTGVSNTTRDQRTYSVSNNILNEYFKKDLTVFKLQLKKISCNEFREESLYSKYQDQFESQGFYEFWHTLRKSHAAHSKSADFDQKLQSLQAPYPGFFMNFWQKICEIVLSLLGYEVLNFHGFKSELAASEKYRGLFESNSTHHPEQERLNNTVMPNF